MNTYKKTFLILLTVIFMDFLAGTEFDLFVPSFPQLQNYFNLSPFWVEALLSINFIGYCISLFVVGGLADHYGRKPIIIVGLLTFIFGSILCLWAPWFQLLLLGRLLQGIGIAAPAILSFLIIADSYPLKKQQFFSAMLNGVMNTSVAIAPVAGSFITLYFHWQGNFVALLILGIITLTMAIFCIPTFKLPEHKEALSPLAYIPLFKSKPLRLLMINTIFSFVPYWVFVGMAPLLYMKNLGVSLNHFGYYQGVLALIFALGSVIFGLVITRYEMKKMLYVSLHILIFSFITISLVSCISKPTALLITLAFIPFIISQVIPGNLLYPVVLNFIPEAKARVSAITQGSRLIFSAICLQITGYFYQGSFRDTGIILAGFILAGIITSFMVIKNREIMEFSK